MSNLGQEKTKVKKWLATGQRYATIIGVVAGVVGGLIGYSIAVIQFSISLQNDQLKAAQGQYTNYLSGEVGKATSKLDKLWHDEAVISDIETTPPQERNDRITVLLKENDLTTSVQILLDFYKGTVSCVVHGSCDLEKTCELFHKDMVGFLSNYYGFFKQLAKQWYQKDIVGSETRKFAVSSCNPYVHPT